MIAGAAVRPVLQSSLLRFRLGPWSRRTRSCALGSTFAPAKPCVLCAHAATAPGVCLAWHACVPKFVFLRVRFSASTRSLLLGELCARSFCFMLFVIVRLRCVTPAPLLLVVLVAVCHHAPLRGGVGWLV